MGASVLYMLIDWWVVWSNAEDCLACGGSTGAVVLRNNFALGEHRSMKKFLIAVTEGHLLLLAFREQKVKMQSSHHPLENSSRQTIISPEVSVVSELRDLNLEDFIVWFQPSFPSFYCSIFHKEFVILVWKWASGIFVLNVLCSGWVFRCGVAYSKHRGEVFVALVWPSMIMSFCLSSTYDQS